MFSKSVSKLSRVVLAMLLSTIIVTGGIQQKVLGNEVTHSPQLINESEIIQSPIEDTALIEQDANLDQKLYQIGGLSNNDSIVSQALYSELETYIYNGLMALDSRIYLTDYSVSKLEIFDIYCNVINSHPDLFHVSGSVSYASDDSKVLYIVPNYSYEKSKIATMRAQLNTEVAKVKSIITPDMTDLEIALAVNDYLAVKVAYDYNNYLNNTIPEDSYNAYGTLVLNVAVCQGYSLAYKYLLETIFGIPTELVVSNSMNHAWNKVLIDGHYYHVDITWNDPIVDTLGNARHNYFMLSDQEIAKRKHFGWASSVEGLSTRFDNYFWDNVKTPFARVLDKYYYVDTDSNLIEWNYKENTNRTISKLKAEWYYKDGYYYSGGYQKLFTARGKIFFNEPDGIYSIDVDGTGYKKEYAAGSIPTGLPFSFAYRNSQFQYYLSSSPNLTGNELMKVAPITLGPAVAGVTISSASLTLTKGQISTLVAAVTPADAMNKKIVWSSSNPAVATVTGGVVTALAAGEVTITATTIDGSKEVITQVNVVQEDYLNKLEVLAGVNRFETAVAISKYSYLTSDTAILVLGTDFPDALSAGPLAMKYNAPILLSQNSRISTTTLNELKRLQVKNVILLGGEAVITASVEASLKENGILQITRIAGNNRYETAEKVAYHLTDNQKQVKVILASGENFADALSVGSYASKEGIPILLSRKGSLPTATKKALSNLLVDEVLILGGLSAIDDAVIAEIKSIKPDMKVTRIQGESRYSTAVEVSNLYFGSSTQGIIASGVEFADALAAAPFAAKHNIPILLVNDRSVSTVLKEYLNKRFELLYVIGGEAAIGVPIKTQLLEEINQE